MKIKTTYEKLTLATITIPPEIYSYYTHNYDIDHEFHRKLTKIEILNLLSFFIGCNDKYKRELTTLYNIIHHEIFDDLIEITSES